MPSDQGLGADQVEDSVCVLCGAPWLPAVKNRCECGGFCTWGKAKGADPDSWIVTDEGATPRPPPEQIDGGENAV